jgi:hypothetical protein
MNYYFEWLVATKIQKKCIFAFSLELKANEDRYSAESRF